MIRLQQDQIQQLEETVQHLRDKIALLKGATKPGLNSNPIALSAPLQELQNRVEELQRRLRR